jgi:flavin-dependent dehydrogenase
MQVDVAIIGGGPGGSTTGTLLKKYSDKLSVAIFERETFPRDHIGESQLPNISYVLDEMGVWDKVEAANFPIKIGATYRWGRSQELWDFDFLTTKFQDQARPAKFEGQRQFTAFQVDRSIYDDILLKHAREMGCQVFEHTPVRKINRTGSRVDSIVLDSGEEVVAKYYIDASGHSGILRRALDIAVEYPTNLQNIAIWDYWQNATWAEKIGIGGTRIQVMSLPYGWIWFIPMGPVRTSIGLVIPAEYYKNSGMRPAELYEKALAEEARIGPLMKDAISEGKLQTTKDWSFIAAEQSGENWFLVGESSGFADPILSAGLTITHAAGREAAFTILEMEKGNPDSLWLHESYDRRNSQRIANHIRFADYWYTANEQFKDLKAFAQEIARDNDIEMTPEQAWQWIGQAGFIQDDLSTGAGNMDLAAIKKIGSFLTEVAPDASMFANNVFKLNLEGAELRDRPNYIEGCVQREPCYFRGTHILPLQHVFEVWVDILKRFSKLPDINRAIRDYQQRYGQNPVFQQHVMSRLVSALEALISDGWVEASYDPSLPLLPKPKPSDAVHSHVELSANS